MIKDNIVVQSNALMRQGAFSLTLHQYKALLCFISAIKMGDTSDTEYSFSVEELADTMGIEHGSNLTEFKQSLKELADQSWWMIDGSKHSLYRWLNTIDIENGTISIKFHERVTPYLFELKKCFTEYRLQYILPMRSKYGARLYNLLRAYITTKRHSIVNIPIEELKNVLQYDYKAFCDIEKRVLKPAMDDINREGNTDIAVLYTKKKKGAKIISLEFTIVRKD